MSEVYQLVKRHRTTTHTCKNCWFVDSDETQKKLERKATYLFNTYRISLKSYNDILESQEYKCAICGTQESQLSNETLFVDHCHDTGLIRGLLCHGCNAGIGLLKDNPDVIQKAANYLYTFREYLRAKDT